MLLEARSSDEIQVKLLQKHCDRILEVIHNPNPGSFVDDDKKKALKQEYNRLSHKTGALKRGPLPDPLVFLPPEVWTDIIRVAAEENDINLPPTDVLLLLTLVSNEWSRKILNNPRLWTNITIGRGETDAHAKLVTALCLSGDLDFDLTINTIPCHWEADLSSLQVHAYRMKRIAFQSSDREISFDPNITMRFIHHFFASFPHLPALKVIRTVYNLQLTWEDIFAKCPTLSYIYGTIISFDIVRSRSQVPIRACSIDARSSDVLPHFEKLVHLEELEWEAIDDAAFNGQLSLPALVNLVRMEYFNVHNPSLFIILKLVPNLTWLGITIYDNWNGVYNLLFHLKHLPRLLFLRLGLCDVRGSISFPAIQPIETGVQALQFDGHDEENEDGEDEFNEQRDQEDFANHEALFSVFPVYFPHIKRLHLFSGFLGPSVAAYIGAAKYLRSLTLTHVAIRIEHDLAITSLSLEFLEIEGQHRNMDLFVSIGKFPSLLRVTLDQGYSLIDIVESSIYSNIVYLEIRSGCFQMETGICNALRKLRIWDEDGGLPWTNEVLIAFICEPHMYPSLSELELGFIPEWDLLFLMLERRNYLPQSRGIARVETLTLPWPVPPHLAVPLTGILRGRFMKRPSDHDLSFGGFLEAYFDPSVPGCKTCIASLMSCSSREKPPYSHPHEFNYIGLPRDQPEMPTETWEWLLKRDDRVFQWKKARNSPTFHRIPSCTTMRLAQRPFIITGR